MSRRRISRLTDFPLEEPLRTLACVALVLAVSAFGLACAAPEEAEPVPVRDTSQANLDAIMALTADYIEAYNSGDAEAFVALFSDDAIRMPPNALPLEGIDRIRANAITTFETYDGEVTINVKENRFSGDIAVTRGTWALRLVPKVGGEAQEDVGSWLNVSVRGPDGRWRISRNIWNSDRSQETDP